MRVPIREIGPGQHPSELIVQLETRGGATKLIVDKRSIRDDTIEVGYPIAKEDGYLLIELPRETMIGEWRVWVSEEIVQDAGFPLDTDRPRN